MTERHDHEGVSLFNLFIAHNPLCSKCNLTGYTHIVTHKVTFVKYQFWMTVIDAYQRDCNVVIASECVASYDNEHHQIALRYLDGKMAQAMRNAQLTKLLMPSIVGTGNANV
jgi:isochorismate hydrolase